MKERGIEEGSPESAIFGRRLLNALTEAYARMLFGPGFIHGDCHPGNICEWVAHTNHQSPGPIPLLPPSPPTHAHAHAHATVVQPGGRTALIDCGQVKQIPASTKLRLADLVLAVSRYGKEPSPAAAAALSEKVKEFGVEFTADARPEIGGPLGLLLMDGWAPPLVEYCLALTTKKTPTCLPHDSRPGAPPLREHEHRAAGGLLLQGAQRREPPAGD